MDRFGHLSRQIQRTHHHLGCYSQDPSHREETAALPCWSLSNQSREMLCSIKISGNWHPWAHMTVGDRQWHPRHPHTAKATWFKVHLVSPALWNCSQYLKPLDLDLLSALICIRCVLSWFLGFCRPSIWHCRFNKNIRLWFRPASGPIFVRAYTTHVSALVNYPINMLWEPPKCTKDKRTIRPDSYPDTKSFQTEKVLYSTSPKRVQFHLLNTLVNRKWYPIHGYPICSELENHKIHKIILHWSQSFFENSWDPSGSYRASGISL